MPNMQERSLYSAVLDRSIRVTLPTCVLRSVDQAGGLDNYLLQMSSSERVERPVRRLQTLVKARRQAA